ncbi:MAG: undecaprenyl-diphosphate phosphatase [Ruminococcus sp.]
MSVLQAILLGIVQGITEFLPVSSFGHLAAIENAMGITRNTAVLLKCFFT